jgi:hypothetical protein
MNLLALPATIGRNDGEGSALKRPGRLAENPVRSRSTERALATICKSGP